jgi:N-methylhydantoinase B
LLEIHVPVVVEEVTSIPDSGGPGRYRGGLSIRKSYRFLNDASVMIRTIRDAHGSPGMMGGSPGAPPRNILFPGGETSKLLPYQNHLHLEIKAGDRLSHETGGAGGHGAPLLRSSAAVLDDVELGRVSREGARRDYGQNISTLAGRLT